MKDHDSESFEFRSPRRVRLIAHDRFMPRRLAWRFEECGFDVEVTAYDSVANMGPADTGEIIVADLGWNDAEIDRAMQVIFALTAGEDLPNVVALVPRLDPATRPEWAELGVRLVLDRAAPPPEIVAHVIEPLR